MVEVIANGLAAGRTAMLTALKPFGCHWNRETLELAKL
jgi:hypothetical protein